MSAHSRAPESLSEAVLKADECDAAGNHVDALKHLAAAAGNGDVEALTRLGKRLLIGDRAPARSKDAIGLIGDAYERGGAEAAAIFSVLYGIGAMPGSGLNHGFEKLVQAAERGWVPAQQQLRALAAEHPGGGGIDSNESTADWRQLASHVDLAAWVRCPSGEDLSSAPLIRVLPHFLNETVCRWLIGQAEGRLGPALVYEALSKKTTRNETRTNTAATLNVLQTDFVCVLVQARISATVGIALRQFEPIAMLHYAVGEEITEHYDFVDPNVPDYEQIIAAQGQRVITFLIYLNDNYQGGETQFPRLELSHKGRTGDAVFFVNAHPDGTSDLRTLHAGRPPSEDEKWIVSQFIRNRPTF